MFVEVFSSADRHELMGRVNHAIAEHGELADIEVQFSTASEGQGDTDRPYVVYSAMVIGRMRTAPKTREDNIVQEAYEAFAQHICGGCGVKFGYDPIPLPGHRPCHRCLEAQTALAKLRGDSDA